MAMIGRQLPYSSASIPTIDSIPTGVGGFGRLTVSNLSETLTPQSLDAEAIWPKESH